MMEVDVVRNSHLVDPSLHIWGWEIPVYLFLGGLTAGLMILTPILNWRIPGRERSVWSRWLPFMAPALLSIGMLALLLDLEYKVHVFRFYTTFQWTSPMSWGAWILILIYPAVLLLGAAGLGEQEWRKAVRLVPWAPLRRLLDRARRVALQYEMALEWSNLLLGIALGTYTGILLGTLGARALWSSGLLGPLFLVSGLSAGAAFLLLFPISQPERRLIRNLDVAAIGLEAILLLFFFMDLVNASGQAGRDAASLLLGGAYTAEFWSIVVFAGLLLPLFMEAHEARRRTPHVGIVAPALLLIGGLALRWILVSAGQASF